MPMGFRPPRNAAATLFFMIPFSPFHDFFVLNASIMTYVPNAKQDSSPFFLFFYLFRKRFPVLISIFCLLFSVFHNIITVNQKSKSTVLFLLIITNFLHIKLSILSKSPFICKLHNKNCHESFFIR